MWRNLGWKLVGAGVLVGVLSGFGLGHYFGNDLDLFNCKFEYISPVRCSQPALEKEGGYGKLETNLVAYINQQKQANGVTRVGLHFRNLRNSATVGVNANEFFYPASLFKVPVAMVYYRMAQQDASVLKQTLIAPSDFINTISQTVPAIADEIQPNQTYMVDDLIRRMLVYSDNRALSVLKQQLTKLAARNNDDDLTGQILEDLGILYQSHEGDLVVSARQYSSVMRVLYNTNFLDNEYSEKLLKILSETDFADGLAKYLPNNTKIAHKYGITRLPPSDAVQLMDCGIVYHPKVNYSACVMVEAKNYTSAQETIAGLSKIIYQEIDSRY